MERKIEISVDEKLSEKTIRSVLFDVLRLSGRIVTKLKNNPQGIMLNSKRARANEILKKGDVLVLNIEDSLNEKIKGEDITPVILYEDEDVIAIDKPFNMPTHPSGRQKTATAANMLAGYFKEKFTFRVITRLDKDTSGVLLVAKNQLSAHRLNEEMKKGKIEKEYIALVHGKVAPYEGSIDLPIKKSDSSTKRIVSPDGKRAKTYYKVIKENEALSLVRLIPVTGRTHQLRVHMSHIGHPLYGDELYSGYKNEGRCRLHCRKISFIHPVTREKLTINATTPKDIENLI